ncbi:MAG: sugar transferase [Chloroflexi bacterium]|nr:sugar transferase [Chloroflexota bacterium]
MGTQTIDPKIEAGSYSAFSLLDFITALRQNSHTKLRVVQFALVLADFLTLGAAFLIAYNIRFIAPTEGFFDQKAVMSVTFYARFVYVMLPLWLAIFVLFRLYDPAILFGGHQEYMLVFNSCTAGIMLVIVITYLDPTLTVARAWLLIAWFLSIFMVMVERFVLRRVIYALRRRGHFMSPAYIVGANSEGVAIAEQLMSTPMAGVNILGFLDDNLRPGEEVLPGVVVHGPTSRAEELARRFGVERLIVATSGVQRDRMLDLFRRFVNAEDVSMWLSSGMYEILTTGVRVQDVGSVPMVSVNRVRLTGMNVIAKAVLDYVGAFLGILALSPLFLGIIIIMKLTDPGPIFYRRRVVGVGGREFDAFKFRTMVVNSQEVLDELLARDPEARAEYEQYYKLKNDPRITKIGAFLRKTSIDELPQLANVLRGEMSLVGPRMITMAEVEKYGRWGLNLQTVKPGITGLWQVSGRSDITYEERVRLDMRYIRNYSIWLDIQILVQTVPSVLMSRGAY